MKTSFTNRDGKKIVVLVENTEGKNGPVFIAHGLAGNKEQPHIKAYAKAFLLNDYIVVRWDAINTLGESEGSLFNATLTNYFKDFEDVINWAKTQEWYKEPFVVTGHSLGSACNILYTQKHPKKIKALAPTSAFLSGSTYLNWLGEDEVSLWQRKGYREEESKSKPGIIKKFNWKLAEDLLKYELFDIAKSISVPILLIVGSKDWGTPLKTQQKFYDLLPTNNKELHIIKEAGHTFRTKEHLKEIQDLMTTWAKKQI